MGDEEEGPTYRVQYLDGKKEEIKYLARAGKCKVFFPNGDTFEGTINEDLRRHGKGVYVWKMKKAGGGEEEEEEEEEEEGSSKKVVPKYDGDWVDGAKEGVGRMVFPNGDVYHGLWSANSPNGEGTCLYANGDSYSGAWRHGAKHGEGTYVFAADGSKLVGEWDRGSITRGQWILADGTRFAADFASGQPVGEADCQLPNKIRARGEFLERMREDEVHLSFDYDPSTLRG